MTKSRTSAAADAADSKTITTDPSGTKKLNYAEVVKRGCPTSIDDKRAVMKEATTK